MRVVLVDDNPDDRALVLRELEREFSELEAVHITDQESFARVLDQGDIDLVVTDFQLRWTDGLAVLAEVKRRVPATPVIMFTGTGSEEIAVAAMKGGVDEYVIKSTQRLALLRLAARSAVDKKEGRVALAAAEARYRELFETVPVGLCRVQPDRGIVDANPAFLAMFGVTRIAELQTAEGQAVFFAPPHDLKTWMSGIDSEGVVVDRQRSAQRRNGDHFWIEENVRVIRDADNHAIAYDGVVVDVTARKRAESLLVAAKEEAETAARVKTAFLATMSHELRTPLNAVIGFSEMLKMQLLGPLGVPRYEEYVNDIHDSASHLLSLVNDLLEVTNLETGRRELRDELVSIVQLVAETTKIISLSIIARDLTITSNLAPNLPHVRADPMALRQVLLNLLSNAVKFTRSPGQISVSANVDSAGAVVIGVKDTGAGMAVNDIPKALAGEMRTDNPFIRTSEGAGLGLPITKSLVELHGGHISIESRPGAGTNVRVTLPAERVMSGTRH
jgi:PAS domain S-box-containing protein